MKSYLPGLLALVFLTGAATAQSTLYATNSGETRFFSETPAENISAVNAKSQAILNTATGELAVRMNMRDFTFPNKLMQEHFNENYMESDKYPTATFRGKVEPAPHYTQKGTYAVTAKGTFTVHGQSQERTLSGQLIVTDGTIELQTNFDVALADHKIEVPKIVFVKIAQVINVKARYVLKPYKK
ncbi:YceI family protein [Rhabdobacter roseus]|uniref:Polyisoprenoid-binding protein YceI n=1 Tax=Rhabdobacter roseus TaxID=1655419 RepID=A0A840TH11_9BACT|nr:YceI family protein [Rhabdobacter roseus]MBB5282245.1 polyisoprenoid-binding protein YceI [Rhabdobacter roseus]